MGTIRSGARAPAPGTPTTDPAPLWYEPAVGRHDDDALEAILERGRQTRKPVPRGLWIAAALVAVICATGIVAILVGDNAPARAAVERPPPSGASFGSGLAIGAAAGQAIGFALARAAGQRPDHSSRRRP